MVAKKNRCLGLRESPAPLAAKKSSCQGRKRVLAPLVAKKNSCRGRRRGSGPLMLSGDRLSEAAGNKDMALKGSARVGCFPWH